MKHLLAALFVAASATGAFAAPITMTMTASNIFGNNLDKLGLTAGDTITSVATYDPDAPTERTVGFFSGNFLYDYQTHADADAVWSIGGTDYIADGSDDYIYARQGGQVFAYGIFPNYNYYQSIFDLHEEYRNQFSGLLNGIAGITHSFGYFYAGDYDATRWSDLALDGDDLNAAPEQGLYITFEGTDSNGASFSGYVASGEVTFSSQPFVSVVAPVPLPASALMLGAALLGFAGLRRRMA